MKKYFGTDGMRGLANKGFMTPELALRLGQVLATYFSKDHPEPRIVIGKDPRKSSYIFEFALAAGACSMGASTYLLGPLPTPAVAALTPAMRAQAGVMVSASHNPFHDNGIKVFGADGYKVPDSVEEQLEAMMDTPLGDEERPCGAGVGRAFRIADALGRYIMFAKETFPDDLSLHGLKIVVDCANGAAYRAAPAILEELGAHVIQLGGFPDGVNINQGVGALHPGRMADAVRIEGANLGIALDGDADRVILADENGDIIDGDAVMALLGEQLLAEGRLSKNTVVATIMSNMGLEAHMKTLGGRVVRTRVGDRYVSECMRKNGYNFGGEQSGHVLFFDYSTTGDGMVTALQVLAGMVRRQRPLSELAGRMERYPQINHTIKVVRKVPLEELPGVQTAISGAETTMGEKGRVVVRYSGTENVLRIMVECEDEALAERSARDIKDAASHEIGIAPEAEESSPVE